MKTLKIWGGGGGYENAENIRGWGGYEKYKILGGG